MILEFLCGLFHLPAQFLGFTTYSIYVLIIKLWTIPGWDLKIGEYEKLFDRFRRVALKRLLFFILVMIVLSGYPFEIFANDAVKRFILVSGEEQGLYYRTGIFIENASKKILTSAEIVNLNSDGSLENIERLKNGFADFAILQRDVAVKNYHHPQNPFRNFEIVMPLFPEALQIFVRGEAKIIDFSEFIRQIKKGKIKTFAIGAPHTTSNLTIRLIFNLFGVDRAKLSLDERPFSESFVDFKKGKLCAWAVIIGYPFPPIMTDENLNSTSGLVSMNSEEIQFILSRISHLSKIEIPGSVYPLLSDNQQISSVGTWAFLASKTGVMDEIEMVMRDRSSTFPRELIKIIKSKKTGIEHSLAHTFEKGGYLEFMEGEDSREINPELSNYTYFFRGLPLGKEMESIFYNSFSSLHLYLILTAIFGFIIVLVYKNNNKIDYYKYWIRYRHFIFSSLFLIFGFFIFSEVIMALENHFFKIHSVKSAIVDLNIFDVQIWLLVFALTRVNNDIFPLSIGGQIVATAATYLGWFAAIFSIVGEFIFAFNKKKRRSGMKQVKSKNHFCICGWNESVPHLITNSISALKSSFTNNNRKIVVISTNFKEYLEKDTDLQKLHDRHDIEFINGEPRDVKSLEIANILNAKSVLLVADDRSIEADERTLLRALAISRYVRQIENNAMDSIYMIAEINHQKFNSSLVEADVNEVICSSNIAENLMIQSMFNHGVASLINSVIFFNEGNEFYVIDVKEHLVLVGKTFDELLVALRRVRIQLIGIKICFYDSHEKLIIDRKEIKKRLNKRKLTKEYIINPVKKEEVSYKISINDQLLVFALDEKKIKCIDIQKK